MSSMFLLLAAEECYATSKIGMLARYPRYSCPKSSSSSAESAIFLQRWLESAVLRSNIEWLCMMHHLYLSPGVGLSFFLFLAFLERSNESRAVSGEPRTARSAGTEKRKRKETAVVFLIFSICHLWHLFDWWFRPVCKLIPFRGKVNIVNRCSSVFTRMRSNPR